MTPPLSFRSSKLFFLLLLVVEMVVLPELLEAVVLAAKASVDDTRSFPRFVESSPLL